MTEQISQRELRNDSGRIMRELDQGHTFVVTRNHQPIGELRPLRRNRFVDADTIQEIFRTAPEIDRQRMREDLDRLVNQDPEPRG